MAKYSLELRELFEPIKYSPPLFTRSDIENIFKSYNLSDYLTSEQIEVVEQGVWSKDRLAKKIVDYYYMSEIGFETIGLFFHFAKLEMEMLMEEYLPLIYSASIKYDPLINVDFTETLERETTGVNVGTNSSSSSGLTINSDTPQGQINKQAILNGNYATSTNANEISDSTNSRNDSGGTENYTKRMVGNSGVSATAQKMIEQYRDNIRAIDREIIKKLDVLFMGLY